MNELDEGKTIILADDDRFVVDSLRKSLEGTGFTVAGDAPNGLELIKLCEKIRPDVVIVDIEMPVMGGIEATRKLVEDDLTKCVVVLTSFDDESYIHGAIEAGAAGYLTKPVDPDVLAPTIYGALKKSSAIYNMNKKVSNIHKRLDTREIIEKAKLLMMEKNGMSEPEAYGYIKNMSKERNTSMADVAEIILAKEE